MNGLTLDEALLKVGGRGRAQLLSLLCCGFAMAHSASFLMSLPLTLTTPGLLCETEIDSMKQCSLGEACMDGQKAVFSSLEERSVVYEWKLICSQGFYAEVICLCALFGLCLGCVLSGQLGDSLGRKKTLGWLMLCSCVCQFVLYCSASAGFYAAVVFLEGLAVPAPGMMAAVLITETTDKRARGPFIACLGLFYLLGTALAYLLSFLLLTWRPFLLLSCCLAFLSFSLLPFLPESPRFLAFNLSHFQRCRAVLQTIAKRNHCEMFEDKLLGERANEYDETGTTKLGESKKDSKADPSNEYIGSANNAEEREKELNRGQKCTYVDLIRLKSIRADWLRTTLLVAVLAVNWAEVRTSEGSVRERYTDRGLSLGVAISALLVVALTANFAGRKLLARLAFCFQGCLGFACLLFPELGSAVYVRQGSIAACCLATGVCMQLTLETPASPLRALFVGAVLSFGALVWTASRFAVLNVPTHSPALVLLIANLIGLASTWRMRETAKKRLRDFVEEMVPVAQLPAAQADPSSDPKRVAPKEPSFDAFNEEVRGLE